ncbi:MAG: hypothetical protein ACOC0D_01505 [Spirochaeta sp.]
MDSQRSVITSKNRVYTIDQECYVIYMGKADRKYRPFLRIGTSAFIPRDIRRHIGSVVLTDRMTGDYFLEADCLEKPVSHHMHYVGSPELVDAVKHFIRNEQIAEQPLGPATDVEREEGGRVVFYGDRNLRVFLDGHRLFDLFDREKQDQHAVYQLQRMHDIVSTVRGAYRSQDFAGSGFMLLQDGSPIVFEDSTLQTVFLHESTAADAAQAMIPIGMLNRFAGQAKRDALLDLCKWHLTRGDALQFMLDPDSANEDPDSPSAWALSLFQLMKQSGADCTALNKPLLAKSGVRLSCLPEEPHLLVQQRISAPGDCVLQLPGEMSWGVHPPLLRGVAYRLDTRKDFSIRHVQETQSFWIRLMGAEPRDQLKDYTDLSEQGRREIIRKLCGLETADDFVGLAVRVWAWNQRALGYDLQDAEMLAGEVETVHRNVGMPMTARLLQDTSSMHLIFLPVEGMSRGVLKSCDAARKKIQDLLDIPSRQSYFESERARLSATLQELLKARHVEPVAAPKTAGNAAAGQSSAAAAAGKSSAATEDAASTAHAGQPEAAGTGRNRAAGPGGSQRGVWTAPADGRRSPGNVSRQMQPQRTGAGGFPWRKIAGAALLLLLVLGIGGFFLRSYWLNGGGETITAVDRSASEAAESPPAENAESDAADSGDTGDVPAPEEAGQELPEEAGQDRPEETREAAGAESAEEAEADPAEQAAGAEQAGQAEADPAEQEPATEAPAAGSENAQQDTVPAAEDGSAAEALPESVSGRWSITEVLRVTNWIAYNNGYALIGEEAFPHRDPDWIYPGNVFMLPDGSMHRVRDHDNMWQIAVEFLSEAYRSSGMQLEEFRAFIENLNYNQTVLQGDE